MGSHEQFKKVLIAHSESNNYEEALKEWVYRGKQEDKENNCICGQDIKDNRFVTNRFNKIELIIGNCCIRKFGIERNHYNKSKLSFLEYALEQCNSVGARDYLTLDTLPRIKDGKKFNITDIGVIEKITGTTDHRFGYTLECNQWNNRTKVEEIKRKRKKGLFELF